MIVSLALLIASAGSQHSAAPPTSDALLTSALPTAYLQRTAMQDRLVPEMPRFAPCKFEQRAILVERKSELPPEALLELTRLFAPIGGIADAGEFFESSDAATSNAPTARFIRAYFVQNTWFIWFERGGVALTRSTVALTETHGEKTGTTVLRAAPGSHFSGDLCAGSNAFLSGARSAG